jgi:hypothetical protein
MIGNSESGEWRCSASKARTPLIWFTKTASALREGQRACCLSVLQADCCAGVAGGLWQAGSRGEVLFSCHSRGQAKRYMPSVVFQSCPAAHNCCTGSQPPPCHPAGHLCGLPGLLQLAAGAPPSQPVCVTPHAPPCPRVCSACVQIAKNITLAGVGHVTLLDDAPAADLLGTNFLITESTEEGLT